MAKTKRSKVGEFIANEFGALIGAKVTDVREMNEHELAQFDWESTSHSPAVMVELNDGLIGLALSQDPEGNSPGFAFVLEERNDDGEGN